MTSSAAGLEDVTRWLGLVVTVVGALVINPAATAHFVRSVLERVRHGGHQVLGFVARFVPRLRRDATIRTNTGTASGTVGRVTAHARGIVGWGPEATVEEKLDLLDDRTRRLHKEVGDLQTSLRKTEKVLRREATEAANGLRSEIREIREAVDTLRQEAVRSEASALPIIVIGVLLSGIAPDAARFQVWFWVVVLAVLCSVAGFVTWRIVRLASGSVSAA